jgi:hypothetical protein
MKYFLISLTLTCFTATAGAQPGAQPFKPDYLLYGEVLRRHVNDRGRVNYAALKADKDFPVVLKSMSLMHPNARWSREEQMSFWINTYNMFVLKLICDHYPIGSVQDIPDAFTREFVKIGVHNYSLDYIEKEMLMKKFKLPEIHFAINCGAVSCPPLQNTPIRPEGIEQQLKKLGRTFINDTRFNTLTEKKVEVSLIFEWYAADFASYGTIADYLRSQTTVQWPERVKIVYKPYDWSLNAQ